MLFLMFLMFAFHFNICFLISFLFTSFTHLLLGLLSDRNNSSLWEFKSADNYSVVILHQ